MLVDQKQNVWQLPAVLNLTLGGMGAGLYLLTLVLNFPQNATWTQSLAQTAIIKLLGPVLVGIGLLALTVEAGHPLNSIYLLTNLRNSWMSREALAAGIFILAAGLDWLFPNPILRGVAALAGLVFIISQGMMVWRASGVFTWDVAIVPWFFLTCGLTTGGGLLLIVCTFFNWAAIAALPILVMLIAIANAVVWIVYLSTPSEEFRHDIAAVRQVSHITLTLGIGHLLPIVLIILALTMQLPQVEPMAGLMLIFGGVMQKFAFALQARTMRSVISA